MRGEVAGTIATRDSATDVSSRYLAMALYLILVIASHSKRIFGELGYFAKAIRISEMKLQGALSEWVRSY